MDCKFTIQWLSRWFIIIITTSLALNHYALADDEDSAKITIKSTRYNAEKHRLKVKMKYKGEKPYQVKLLDETTGTLLFSKKTKEDSLEIKIKNIENGSVPCSIKIQIGDLSQSKKVKNAPDNCSSLSGDVGQNNIVSAVKIDDAKYEENTLTVKGELTGGDPEFIELFDDKTGKLLSEQSPDDSHFRFKLVGLTTVPCRIKVQAGQVTATKDVEHAPHNCSTTPPPPPTENQPPICSISSPLAAQ